jgi:DNA-binding transcriptional MerR regulator
LKIGALARLTRTTAPTIRYYEEIGLLPRASRQDGGQRRYGEEDVRRLKFIRRCRDLALPLHQIRVLLSMMRNGVPCSEARDMAHRHLLAIRTKVVELEALEQTIAGLISSCDASRTTAPDSNCGPWREAAAGRGGESLAPSP